MYIEHGPVTKGKVTRYQWALKRGKGKVLAASPLYASPAVARRKAIAAMERTIGCETVYEVPALKP